VTAMAATLKLEIVTPRATVFSENVEYVGLPTADGDIGVYPEHVRLITQLVPGEITVTKNGAESLLAVGEGLVDVGPAHVSILTDMAIRAEDIDEAKVAEARERAAARLREKISDEEVAAVNASLVRALAQLQVRRRSRIR
jgi:F-type H+-transporting ATPase subunit epsilon